MATKDTSQTKFWISDLFQPKFTQEDLFFKQDGNYQNDKSTFKIANDFYSKVYSKVIFEEQQVANKKTSRNNQEIKNSEDQLLQLDFENRKSNIKTVNKSSKSNGEDKTLSNPNQSAKKCLQ